MPFVWHCMGKALRSPQPVSRGHGQKLSACHAAKGLELFGALLALAQHSPAGSHRPLPCGTPLPWAHSVGLSSFLNKPAKPYSPCPPAQQRGMAGNAPARPVPQPRTAPSTCPFPPRWRNSWLLRPGSDIPFWAPDGSGTVLAPSTVLWFHHYIYLYLFLYREK